MEKGTTQVQKGHGPREATPCPTAEKPSKISFTSRAQADVTPGSSCWEEASFTTKVCPGGQRPGFEVQVCPRVAR